MANSKSNSGIFLIKRFWWDFKEAEYWFSIVHTFLEVFPGESGKLLRGLFYKTRMKKCGDNFTIAKGVTIAHPDRLCLGANVRINCNCYIDAAGGIEIGSDVLIGPAVKIWSVSHNYKNKNVLINKQGYSYDPIKIGSDVWIGANTVILPGVIIPDKVVIGASSCVGKKTLIPGGVYMGNPIKKIGERV